MSNHIVPLGSCILQYRDEIWVDDARSYGQITISNKGLVTRRGTKLGASIGRKRQFAVNLKTHPNTLIFTRQGIYDGAIGFAPSDTDGCIATENMPMFSLKPGISREYFEHLLLSSVFKNEVRKLVPKGAAQKSIHERELLLIKIPLPPLEAQCNVANAVARNGSIVQLLQKETVHQQFLLGQLKRAILQEAIEGRLTADWRADHPDAEPASELFHRIQAEKDLLIAAKKIRRTKPFSKISPDEMPSDIPRGWEWCRLGQLIDETESGWSPACHTHPAPEGKWGVLKTTAIQVGQYIDGENKELPASLDPRPEHEAFVGDILVTRAGPANRVGICALVRETRPLLMISDKIIRFRPVLMNGAYIELFANSPLFQNLIKSSKQGMAQSQVNISQVNLKATPVPLPPLAEQVVIVDCVERLMATCSALEENIEHARDYASDLVQAVLKEAFASVSPT